MGDRANGWITVGHRHGLSAGHQHGGLESDAEQEQRERETIASWDNDEQWPSVHKPPLSIPDAKRFDTRLALLKYLGGGSYGRVEKVEHRSICLARKRITRRLGIAIEDLRQEVLTMRKLDHRHVVKLVAAYMPRTFELCLLIWPVAVCDLDTLLVDLDQLRLGTGDREDILGRLKDLELNDLSAVEPTLESQSTDSSARCPFEFLRGVVGCIARGLAHCHLNDVRHLDIKPSNILLKAGRVYLADFGISKDVSGLDQTAVEGKPGTEKWRAPEIYGIDKSSMQLSDIYSLGLVFLSIATVLYKVRLSELNDALLYHPDMPRHEALAHREEKLRGLLDTLSAQARVTPPFMFTHEGLETVRPRPLVGLIAKLTSPVPSKRPPADKVDEKLSMLGGVHQIYHASCCKRPISWVEDKWDKKFSALAGLRVDNDKLKERIANLEGLDKTYEDRLKAERKSQEQVVSNLSAKLKELEDRCHALENSNKNNHHHNHHNHNHSHGYSHNTHSHSHSGNSNGSNSNGNGNGNINANGNGNGNGNGNNNSNHNNNGNSNGNGNGIINSNGNGNGSNTNNTNNTNIKGWRQSMMGWAQHERQNNHPMKLEGTVVYRTTEAPRPSKASQPHPSSIPRRPSIGPSSLSSPRISSNDVHYRTPPGSAETARKSTHGIHTPPTGTPSGDFSMIAAAVAARGLALKRAAAAARPASPEPSSPGFMSRTHSGNSTTGHHLRSRGSGSKLPLPVTPISRSQTPKLNREQSLTDSSMASSVFSERSIDSLPTPAMDSPATERERSKLFAGVAAAGATVGKALSGLREADLDLGSDEEKEEEELRDVEDIMYVASSLARSRQRRRRGRRSQLSPTRSVSPNLAKSWMELASEEPERKIGLTPGLGPVDESMDQNATVRPALPRLLPSKSWAEIAKEKQPTADPKSKVEHAARTLWRA